LKIMKFLTLIGMAAAVSMKARQGDNMVDLIAKMQGDAVELESDAQRLDEHFAQQIADYKQQEVTCED